MESDMPQTQDQAREFSSKRRDKLSQEGKAMSDGSYPIVTAEDLRNAIQAYGRAKNKSAVKRHIIKRARALGKTDLLPDDWKSDSSMLACDECERLGFVTDEALAAHVSRVHEHAARSGTPESDLTHKFNSGEGGHPDFCAVCGRFRKHPIHEGQ